MELRLTKRQKRLGVWAAALAWIVGAWLLPAGAASAEDPVALEYKVKAGYLYNFAKFVEWPAQALPAPNSPIVIGVLDGGDALAVIRSVLEGKNVDAHPVQVKAVTIDQIGTGIHILLVTRANVKFIEEIRAALGRAATLLVGETEQFAEGGGMIGFSREKESIRLCLNLERAMEAGLKVSSKLANVAKPVKSKPNKTP